MDIKKIKNDLIRDIQGINDPVLILNLQACILQSELKKLPSEPTIVSLMQLQDKNFKKSKPVSLVWKDEPKVKIKSWKEFYLKVIELLIKEGYITVSKCPFPDRYGKSRYTIHIKEYHPSGERLKLSESVDGFFIECLYDSEGLIKNLSRIFEIVDLDQSAVTVEYKLKD